MATINKGTTHVVADAEALAAGGFISQHKTQASAEKNAARIASMCDRINRLNKIATAPRKLMVLPVSAIAESK